MIRISDARLQENNYINQQSNNKEYLINIEARSIFYRGLSVAFLKYMASTNYYGTRNRKINNQMVTSSCLRCSTEEDWEHIILYPIITEEKKDFLRKLYNKLKKIDTNNSLETDWKELIHNIIQYFK